MFIGPGSSPGGALVDPPFRSRKRIARTPPASSPLLGNLLDERGGVDTSVAVAGG